MQASTLYLMAADAVLAVHALFVLFVIAGLVLIIAGRLRRWQWVRNRTFRWLHLLAIAVVALQAWLGVVCPLTSFEMFLRERAGDATYSGAFVAHWLERIIYWQLPAWFFVTAYTVFGVLVAAAWFWVPPGRADARGSRAGYDRDEQGTA